MVSQKTLIEEGYIPNPLKKMLPCANCGQQKYLFQEDDAGQFGLEEIWACAACVVLEEWPTPLHCWPCDECGGMHPNGKKCWWEEANAN